jgi:glycosyltransferase involved in cell wall biosynthesis
MLKIAYSGSLNYFQPKNENSESNFFKKWLWTFKNKNIDSSIRSGYYLIKAISLLKKNGELGNGDLMVELWGNIDKGNNFQIEYENVSEFFFIERYLPKTESINRIKNTDVLFLPLEKSNTTLHRNLFIPGKLYEYLETGKPILAMCEDSDCRTILEESGLGICIRPDDIDSLSKIILKLIHDGNYLASFKPNYNFIKQFSFKEKTKQLTDIFREIDPGK